MSPVRSPSREPFRGTIPKLQRQKETNGTLDKKSVIFSGTSFPLLLGMNGAGGISGGEGNMPTGLFAAR